MDLVGLGYRETNPASSLPFVYIHAIVAAAADPAGLEPRTDNNGPPTQLELGPPRMPGNDGCGVPDQDEGHDG